MQTLQLVVDLITIRRIADYSLIYLTLYHLLPSFVKCFLKKTFLFALRFFAKTVEGCGFGIALQKILDKQAFLRYT